ncbi:polysaccharide deacetylase family protein [Vibrio mangrovi]|uniref:Polysaccharide deacetylase n=1 Tax=Vibrio mangrovi TaxID=474394 RepID=A0A1Y6IUJ0_9VIBR|nr:polysaccharide deacetylase family protein [Vibrio mangrovi]MDW6003105.1 polysaccharide deacetylase family protein [Vibrio mangrovi]SMS01347.1 Polysaccharide deacetylase [Vibrio mangrovi]
MKLVKWLSYSNYRLFDIFFTLFLFIGGVTVQANEEVPVNLPTPTLLESFDSMDGWTVNGGGIFRNVCPLAEGEAAMQVSGMGKELSYAIAQKPLAENINSGDMGVIVFAVKKTLPRVTSNLNVRLGTPGGAYTKVNYNINVANLNSNSPLKTYWVAFHQSEDPLLSQSVDISKIRIGSPARNPPYLINNTIDALYANAKGQATVVIGFDDAEDTIASVAYPYMAQYDFSGTVYLPTQQIGWQNRLTWEQVTTLADAGWAIAVDGSPDDTNMTDAADVSTAVANAVSEWHDLEAHGLASDAMYHLCYPGGKFFDTSVRPVQVTAMVSDGTNVVTLDGLYPIRTGMRVYGSNVPENTYVINGGGDEVSSVTLSQNIPAQSLPAMFNDESGEFYLGKLPEALHKAGFKSGRITVGGDMYTRFGFGGREMTTIGQGASYMTFNQFLPLLNRVVLRGTTMETYFHRIVPDPAEGWTADTPNPGINVYESFFKAYIDAVATRVQSGELVVLTKPQWYERDIDNTVPAQ